MRREKNNSCLTHLSRDEQFISETVFMELAKEAILRGASLRFKVGGTSMLPFIKSNDIILVSPLFQRVPSLGEVVAFIHPELKKLMVHRVIGKIKGACLIKGDNRNKVVDGMIPLESILGGLSTLERRGKRKWFGQGPERFLIALLSRGNIFYYLKQLLKPFRQIP